MNARKVRKRMKNAACAEQELTCDTGITGQCNTLLPKVYMMVE
jgi:hypothetical protein